MDKHADILVVVSSRPFDALAKLSIDTNLSKSVMRCETGEQCLRLVQSTSANQSVLVVVDSNINDIASINLVDAVRLIRPQAGIVLVLETVDEGVVNRTMLAGARSAVLRSCTYEELVTAIRRVEQSISVPHNSFHKISELAEGNAKTGAIISVISARGGVGKSTVSALIAHGLATRGSRVALLDADIQFGDLGNAYKDIPALDLEEIERGGNYLKMHYQNAQITDKLRIIRINALPEHSERLATYIPSILRELRRENDVVVVNTGAFWTLVHANILDLSTVAICLLDNTVPGIRSAQKLQDALEKLAVPESKCIFVSNKFNREGLTVADIQSSLGMSSVVTIPFLEHKVRLYLDAGNIQDALYASRILNESTSLLIERIALVGGVSIRGVFPLGKDEPRKFWRWGRSCL